VSYPPTSSISIAFGIIKATFFLDMWRMSMKGMVKRLALAAGPDEDEVEDDEW
jgi:hypothetical protein